MDQMYSVTSSVSALIIASKQTNGNGRIAWPGEPAKRQYFSIPEKILYCMARNPKSPVIYLKLAMSGKYFFEANPLLVVNRIHGELGEKNLCSNNVEKCDKMNEECCVPVDISKITSSKIWLTDELRIYGSETIASMLIPKLYQCETAKLVIVKESMDIEEFKLWAKVFSKFELDNTYIFYDEENDENFVTLDTILEMITEVKEFKYMFELSIFNTTTMKNIVRLKNLNQLHTFSLREVPDEIAIKDIADFIEGHKNTKIRLCFSSDISEEYKKQLDGLVNTVIASKLSNCVIRHYGQDYKIQKIMDESFRRAQD